MSADAAGTILSDPERRAYARLIPRADMVGEDPVAIGDTEGYPADQIRGIVAAVAIAIQGIKEGLRFHINLDPEALEPHIGISDGMVTLHVSSPEIITLVQRTCEERGYETHRFHTGTILYIYAPPHWPCSIPPEERIL